MILSSTSPGIIYIYIDRYIIIYLYICTPHLIIFSRESPGIGISQLAMFGAGRIASALMTPWNTAGLRTVDLQQMMGRYWDTISYAPYTVWYVDLHLGNFGINVGKWSIHRAFGNDIEWARS